MKRQGSISRTFKLAAINQLKLARRKKRKQKSNVPEYGLLEPRQMLNATPVAINNLDYYTPLNTPLVITNPSAGLLANDFDAEGAALSAMSFADAQYGTLTTTNANGTFTFTPDPGYQGFATFTYKASDGSLSSHAATVKIAVGHGLSAQLNGDENGAADNFLHSGVLNLTQPLGGGVNLVYRSDTTPVVMIPIETFLTPGTAIPDSVTASLTIDGTTSTRTFSNANLATGEPLRIVQKVVKTNAATAMYDWDVTVTLKYTGSSDIVRTFSGQQAIVNRANTAFGKNWWVEGLDRVHEQAEGALLVNGDGNSLWFERNGTDYLQAQGDLSYSTLVDNGNGFTLTDKWGNARTFDANGYITSVQRSNNSVPDFTFNYNASNNIREIVDEFGRTYSFYYSGTGKLDSINDFAGRTTDVVVNSNGLLRTVTIGDTAPAEFETGTYTAPTWTFNYTSISRQYYLNKVTDPDAATTQYIYNNSTRRIRQIKNADNSRWYLYPALTEGYRSFNGQSILHVDGANARFQNELGKTFRYETDNFGNVTYFSDALDHETTYEFDANGQLFRTAKDAEPSTPSNPGPHSQPITTFGYSLPGDLLTTVNADGTSTRAEYHPSLHLVTKFWNELNELDEFTYDGVGNLETYTDGEGNTWTYTYDSHGNLLTEQSPDPDGAGELLPIVTTYEYEPVYYNRLEKITWDDTETQEFIYTLSDQLKTFTDELGRVTSYVYDPLSRLVETTLPDPDGVGIGVDAPVYSYEYDPNLQLKKVIDPLNNVTEYQYHPTRHWLTKSILPDPDGAVTTLSSPEIVYGYNAGGQLTSEILPEFDGTSITYGYNDNGQLETRTGPVAGQVFTYDYDHLNRLKTQTDPSGREINYRYDLVSQLLEVIDHDPDGAGPEIGPTTQYDYDNAGRLSTVIDPLGRTTSYQYYDNGWLWRTVMPDPDKGGDFPAPIYTNEYDALGRLLKTIDPGTREETSVYDSRHRVVEYYDQDPDGESGPLLPTSTLYNYDAANRLIDVTNALAQTTHYDYDDLDRVTSVTMPDPETGGTTAGSPVYSFTYDAVGNVKTSTDALSNTTTYDYDNLYRQIKVTQPDPAGIQTSPIWEYEYNDFAQLKIVTDPMLHDTTYGYDTAGRMTSVKDPLLNETTYVFDLLNRVETVTTPDPDGTGQLSSSTTDYDYDIYSRITSMTDANQGLTLVSYDAAGQLLSLTDASDNVTRWAYDDLGRKTMETDNAGYTRSFNYNSVDRLVRQTDKNGRVIWYKIEGYDSTEEWYEHDAGNVPESVVTTTTEGSTGVDEVQTITLENIPSGGIGFGGTHYFRLAFGGDVTAPLETDSSATEIASALEELRMIDDVTVTGSSGSFTVTFGGSLAETDVEQLMSDLIVADDGDMVRQIKTTYDELYRVTDIDDESVDFGFTYDEMGRLLSQTETHGSLNPTIVLDFDYDANSNRTEVAATVGLNSDYKNTYVFDELNRLDSLTQESDGGNLVADKHIQYAYNALGQTTNINRFNNSTATNPALRTSFTYDNGNRLDTISHKKVSKRGASTTLHEYDFNYDNMNRITSIDSTIDGLSTFDFDARSQLTDADHSNGRADEGYVLDATGNRDDSYYDVGDRNLTSTDGTYDYDYDNEGNRIRRTEISSGDYVEYDWDHRNRLTVVRSYEFGNSNAFESIEYEYDAYNRMTRRSFDADGDGSGLAVDTFFAGLLGLGATLQFDGANESDLSHRYLWGLDDGLLADEVVDSLTTEGEILWALADQVGTIRDIGHFNEGMYEFEIVNHRVYDSFGNLTSETDPAIDFDFGFTGRWTDEATGMTHHLNRWFDPAIGKWLSNDPIGFGGGDANIQRYVANNPLSFTDNNGLKAQESEGGGGDDGGVMGVSGINQGADQGTPTSGGTRKDGYTYGVGIQGSANAILGVDGSVQLTYSPDSTEVGIMISISGTIILVDPGAGFGGVVSVTNTPNIKDVEGVGGIVTGNIGTGTGPAVNVQGSNLQSYGPLPLPIKNLTNEEPTVIQVEPGFEVGPSPVSGGVGIGGTGVKSAPAIFVPGHVIKFITDVMLPPLTWPRN